MVHNLEIVRQSVGKDQSEIACIRICDLTRPTIGTVLNQLLRENDDPIWCISLAGDLVSEVTSRAVQALKSSPNLDFVICHPRSIIFRRQAWEQMPWSESVSTTRLIVEYAERARLERKLIFLEIGEAREVRCSINAYDSNALIPSKKAAQDTRVLFFVPYGSWTVHNQVDAAIGLALKIRGAQTLFVGCDGVYRDRCYILAHSSNIDADCANCTLRGKTFFDNSTLNYQQIAQFITDKDKDEIDTWKTSLDDCDLQEATFNSLAVGQWVAPAVCSYFRITKKSLNQPHVRKVHKDFAGFAALTYRTMERCFDQFKPTNLVVFNGNGFVHHAVFQLGQARKIPTICHERGYSDDSFLFVANEPCGSTRPRFEAVDRWSSVALKENELKRTSEFFISREFGRETSLVPFYDYVSNHTDLRLKLSIPPNAKIVGVFTSSEYEFLYQAELEPLNRQLELIDSLIEEFRGRDEYLVIRHHPGIGGGDVGNPDYDFLSRAYKQLNKAPHNVRIIMPHEKITSYALLWQCSAAISFASTIALEAVARGVPTAASTLEAFGRVATHPIHELSQGELGRVVTEMLARDGQVSREELRRLYRFTNHFFYGYSSKLKSVGIKNNYEADFRAKCIEDFAPGNDPVLDRVVNHIIEGSALYSTPTTDDLAGSSVAEDSFLNTKLEEIKQYRDKIAGESNECCSSSEVPKVHVLNLKFQDIEPTKCESTVLISRSPEINESQVSLSSFIEYRSSTTDLLRKLSTIEEQFVLIANPSYQYDPSILFSSYGQLSSASEVAGILWGCWTSNDSETLYDWVFTKRAFPKTLDEASSRWPDLVHPFSLLSLAVWRKENLVELLTQVSGIPNRLQAAKLCFNFLTSDRIVKSGLPMVLASKLKFSDPNKFAFSSLGTEFIPGDRKQTNIVVTNTRIDDQVVINATNEAIALLNSDRNHEALELIEKIVVVRPDLPIVFYARAVAQAKLGMLGEAKASLENLLIAEPSNLEAQNLLAQINNVSHQD